MEGFTLTGPTKTGLVIVHENISVPECKDPRNRCLPGLTQRTRTPVYFGLCFSDKQSSRVKYLTLQACAMRGKDLCHIIGQGCRDNNDNKALLYIRLSWGKVLLPEYINRADQTSDPSLKALLVALHRRQGTDVLVVLSPGGQCKLETSEKADTCTVTWDGTKLTYLPRNLFQLPRDRQKKKDKRSKNRICRFPTLLA